MVPLAPRNLGPILSESPVTTPLGVTGPSLSDPQFGELKITIEKSINSKRRGHVPRHFSFPAFAAGLLTSPNAMTLGNYASPRGFGNYSDCQAVATEGSR